MVRVLRGSLLKPVVVGAAGYEERARLPRRDRDPHCGGEGGERLLIEQKDRE
jgi:hypothetical protein